MRDIANRFAAKARLLSKVEANPETGCHEWIGCTNYHGYGHISIEGKSWSTHRLAYDLEYGPVLYIDDGLPSEQKCVLHKCDNPSCVNPEHLMLGSKADNARDMAEKGRVRIGNRTDSFYYARKKELPEQSYGIARYRINGEVKTLAEWSEYFDITPSTMQQRIEAGWPYDMLGEPAGTQAWRYMTRVIHSKVNVIKKFINGSFVEVIDSEEAA